MALNLIRLPCDIIANVCQSYLSVNDMVRVDTAVCSKSLRSLLLASQAKVTLSSRVSIDDEWFREAISWFALRGIVVLHLTVGGISAETVRDLKFPHWFANLCTLNYEYTYGWKSGWWSSFIGNCPNLEVFAISGGEYVFEALDAVAKSCSKLKVLRLTGTNKALTDSALHLTKLLEQCPDLKEVYFGNCLPTDFQALVARDVSLLLSLPFHSHYQIAKESLLFDDEIIMYDHEMILGVKYHYILLRNTSQQALKRCIITELDNRPRFRLMCMRGNVYKNHVAPLRLFWKREDWTARDVSSLLQQTNVRELILHSNHTITSLTASLIVNPEFKCLTLKEFSAITPDALLQLVEVNPALAVKVHNMG